MNPILGHEFGAPTPRASFQMLTTVARAVRQQLDALRDADDGPVAESDWLTILSHLSKALAERLRQAEDVAEISSMWRHFSDAPEISKLHPGPRRLLDEIIATSQRVPSDLDSCVEQFQTFNQDGHALARQALDKCRQAGLLDTQPAGFSIFWDLNASYYCAGTRRTDAHISWAHQPVPHALYAALVPELVFAHEYFSHLAPTNRYLSRTITEIWLVCALMLPLEYEEAEALAWRIGVWQLLRQALPGGDLQSNTEQVRQVGFKGVEGFAFLLYGRSVETFWKLTRLILTMPDENDAAKELNDLIFRLARPGMLDRIVDSKWRKISDLWTLV